VIDGTRDAQPPKTTRNALLIGLALVALGVAAWTMWSNATPPPVDPKAAAVERALKDSYGVPQQPPPLEGPAPTEPASRGARKAQ